MNKHPSSEQLHDATPEHPAGEVASKKRAKAKAKPAKRTCIMVLGMHRSGTSALTRAISLLGAALPHRVLDSDDSNVSGYWEPKSLNHLHEKMLAEAGSSWDDWRPFDPAKLPQERREFYRTEIARLIGEDYGAVPLFVIKEPRITRFAQMYADILQSMQIDVRYVVASRNPLAVAASLEKRDGSSHGFGTLLWLRHVLDAEQASRLGPRVFVSYEAILDDWRPCLQRVAKTLALNWPRSFEEAGSDIDDFISSASQHHQASLDELDASTTIAGWVKDSYAALRSLERDPNNPRPGKALDRVRQAFDAVSTTFGDAVYPARYALKAALAAAENNIRYVQGESAAAASEHRKSEVNLRELLEQERSASVSAQTAAQYERHQLEVSLACSQDQVAEKENKIIEINEYLLEATKDLERKQKEISDMRFEMENVRKSVFWIIYRIPSSIGSFLRSWVKN